MRFFRLGCCRELSFPPRPLPHTYTHTHFFPPSPTAHISLLQILRINFKWHNGWFMKHKAGLVYSRGKHVYSLDGGPAGVARPRLVSGLIRVCCVSPFHLSFFFASFFTKSRRFSGPPADTKPNTASDGSFSIRGGLKAISSSRRGRLENLAATRLKISQFKKNYKKLFAKFAAVAR